MNTNQSFDSMFGKAMLIFIGFILPFLLLASYVLFGWGNLPLMIFTLSWIGFSILLYMGMTEGETA